MIYLEYTNIKQLIIHKVGNKLRGDGCSFSNETIDLSDALLRENAIKYLVVPLTKNAEQLEFFHESYLSSNLVYDVVSQIFENPENLLESSKNIARHLYDHSVHLKNKEGELYIAYFEDFIINGETVNAVGIFKSENKDTFLKVSKRDGGFEIESEKGININKLDKGCLIFNTEREKGYIVVAICHDQTIDRQYWFDDFLHVRQRKDEYYNTQNILSLCKDFVKNELPQQFDVAKADQIDLLNKSVQFFKEKDSFNLSEFANEVIAQPEIIKQFNQYKSSYAQEHDIDFANNFTISKSAVKKQARHLKSAIKLDKNFHIYIHGNRDLIEQGKDNKGKFYKMYYKEEY
jgi:hypothetical protein